MKRLATGPRSTRDQHFDSLIVSFTSRCLGLALNTQLLPHTSDLVVQGASTPLPTRVALFVQTDGSRGGFLFDSGTGHDSIQLRVNFCKTIHTVSNHPICHLKSRPGGVRCWNIQGHDVLVITPSSLSSEQFLYLQLSSPYSHVLYISYSVLLVIRSLHASKCNACL